LVNFYRDNVELSGSPLTTNIPWGSGYEVSPFFQALQTKATTATRLIVDYCEVYQSFTGYRTNSLLYEDCVAYWPLYEVSGTGYDYRGSNHLTGVTSNPTGVSGVLISGRHFDGNDSLWNENHSISGGGSGKGFTAFGWFKTVYTGTLAATLVGVWDTTNSNRQWLIYCSNRNVLFANSYNGTLTDVSVTSPTNYQTGRWNFFSCYYDNSINTAGIRLNSNYSNFSTLTGMNTRIMAPFCIGSTKILGSSLGSFFSGQISEIGIINRKLTTGEMDYLYNASGGVNFDSLMHFNEWYERDYV
jgi:hypothetical protein